MGIGFPICAVIYLVSLLGVGFGAHSYYGLRAENREMARVAAAAERLRAAQERERAGREAAQEARRSAEADGEARAQETRETSADNRRLRAALARETARARIAEQGAIENAAMLDQIELCPRACYAIRPEGG